MVVFILTWLYLGSSLEVFPFFWDILDNGIFESRFFFYSLVMFLFVFNYSFFTWKELFNNNKDVLFRFFSFFFRAVSILITLLISELKRFYYFLVRIEFRILIKTTYDLIMLKTSNISVIWRPLFRKWSYFGFFKTNRSKWWKNK